MRREDRILALIVSGEPNGATIPGKEDLECFPPSLKTRIGLDGKPTGEPVEPIGGDLRKGGDGWTVAFLKAVAGITGLGFNAFARREHKRVRQCIAAAIGLVLLGAGIWTWDYTRVKTKRFGNFVICNGVPRGLNPVDEDTFQRRYMTYQIEESRRKVRRLSAVNGFGTSGLFSYVEASYVDLFYEDAAGKPLTCKNGFARQTVDYDERGNPNEIRYFGAAGEPVDYKGGSRWVRTYDPLTNEPMKTTVYDLNGREVER